MAQVSHPSSGLLLRIGLEAVLLATVAAGPVLAQSSAAIEITGRDDHLTPEGSVDARGTFDIMGSDERRAPEGPVDARPAVEVIIGSEGRRAPGGRPDVAPAHGTDIHISGSLSYRRTRDRVRIQIGGVTNGSSTRTTGTLYARLFATTSSRLEGSRGYWGATASFGQQFSDNGRLPPNRRFSNIDLETAWESPPPGTYYLFLVISEHPNPDTALDSRRFSNRLTVEEEGGVQIDGSVSYRRTGDRVRIQIGGVTNGSSTRTTGTLYTRLFATTSSRLEGSQGYWVATASFGQQFSDNGRLPPNRRFSNIDLETAWESPPPGTYYLFLVISEHPNPDTALDSRRFSDRLTVEEEGGVQIDGSVSYRRTGDRVRIQIGAVANGSSTRTTGTLYARLFATTSSRLEGSQGYWVATASFGQQFSDNGRLPPNRRFSNIDLETAWESPPPGTYYLFLVISEHPNPDTALDSRRFSDRLTVEEEGGVQIDGSVSYRRTGDRVRIQIGAVANGSSTRTTGTLYARLFATTSSRLEGSQGYWVATASFGQQFSDNGRLPPNRRFSNIDLETAWESPPPGTYYLFLVISEHPNPDTALDSRRFSDRLTVEEEGGVQIDGSVSYRRTGDRVRIQIGGVTNGSSTRTTGTLYARLFATTSSRLEGSQGYWVATASFGQQFSDNGRLPPNRRFSNIDLETAWESPPPGTYYLFLVISERPNLDTALDSRRFSDRLTVEDPTTGSCIEDLGVIQGTLMRQGSWDGGCSSTNRPGRFARYYTFTLRQRNEITIDLTSPSVDSYLFLLTGAGQEGTVIVFDDDTVGTNARIARMLEAGTYTIEATTYASGATGPFTLAVSVGRVVPALPFLGTLLLALTLLAGARGRIRRVNC